MDVVNSTQTEPVSLPRIAIDVGVVVTNMEQALGFYRDLIGLQVVGEVTTSLIGKGRLIQLQHGQSLIKLLEMDQIPSHQSPTGIPTAFGYRYVTLLVSDIDAIMGKMEQHKVSVTIPITQLGNGTTIAMVADPDGNIVEFVKE
ncbi:MAG: VOC family protein [Cyanobacteria bacterium J06635_15]